MSSPLTKLTTAAKLAATDPKAFVFRIKDLLHKRKTQAHLRRLACKSDESPVPVSYGNVRWPFFNDDDPQELGYHQHFDEWYKDLLVRFAPYIKPGAVVVDVGANLGFTTLVFSRLAGPEGVVHSFEPGTQMKRKFEAMVKLNELHNVTLHPIGLGTEKKELLLHIPQSSGNASLTDRVQARALESERVVIEPFDRYLGDSLSRLDFLKIDTEGFESEVLRGAEKTICRLKPAIFIELAADFFESSQASIEFLEGLGYRFTERPNLEITRNGENFLALPLP